MNLARVEFAYEHRKQSIREDFQDSFCDHIQVLVSRFRTILQKQKTPNYLARYPAAFANEDGIT